MGLQRIYLRTGLGSKERRMKGKTRKREENRETQGAQHGLCMSAWWGVEYFCFPKACIGLAVGFSTNQDGYFSDFVQDTIQGYTTDSQAPRYSHWVHSAMRHWERCTRFPFLKERPGEGHGCRDLYDPCPGNRDSISCPFANLQ